MNKIIIQVLLHHNFAFTRPLTVTGAYLNRDGSIIFHQMVLDRVENSEFILQNTLIDHSGCQIRIPCSREFYASYEMMEDCLNQYNDSVYYIDNNEFIALVNEQFNNMKVERWYLIPLAYSITLTPAGSRLMSRFPLTTSLSKKDPPVYMSRMTEDLLRRSTIRSARKESSIRKIDRNNPQTKLIEDFKSVKICILLKFNHFILPVRWDSSQKK